MDTYAVARAHGWTIRASGAAALNLLGLTTQVTSVTTILSPKTALGVQALKSPGEENVDERVIDQIKNHLSEGEIHRMLKEAQFATGWVYEIIKRLANI